MFISSLRSLLIVYVFLTSPVERKLFKNSYVFLSQLMQPLEMDKSYYLLHYNNFLSLNRILRHPPEQHMLG